MADQGWMRSKHARGIKVIPPKHIKMPEPLDEGDKRLFDMNHVFGLDEDEETQDSNVRYFKSFLGRVNRTF